MQPIAPNGGTAFKFDFLKRVDDMPRMFSHRKLEVLRVAECAGGNYVVCEVNSTVTPAVDLGILKTGQPFRTVSTIWFELDPASKSIVKMKAYDCPFPYP